MFQATDNAEVFPNGATPTCVAFELDSKKSACNVAVQKVDDALAMLVAAYAHDKGDYGACLERFQGFEEISRLPTDSQPLLTGFLAAMTLVSGTSQADHAREVVEALTDNELLQIVDDLLGLRHCLRDAQHVLCETTH